MKWFFRNFLVLLCISVSMAVAALVTPAQAQTVGITETTPYRMIPLTLVSLAPPLIIPGPTPIIIPRSAVIVNTATMPIMSMTRAEVIDIFFFHKKYLDSGIRVVVVLPPQDSISFKRMAMLILNISPALYYETILAKSNGGHINPIFAYSEDFVPIKVANTPYSIGYYHDTITINTAIGISVVPIVDVVPK